MSTIHTFESDFTKDLESFVKNPLQFEPIVAWDPRTIAAPERHIAYARALNLSYNTIFNALDVYNNAFRDIENLFRIYLTQDILPTIGSIHPIHEQVWLFGYKWLYNYQLLLTSPTILRSQFYKTTHERMLKILGSMLAFHSAKRATFISVLRQWDPSNPLLIQSIINDDDVVSELDSPSTITQPLAQPVLNDEIHPPSKARLVLARRPHGVRSKTRRSPRSSNRFQSNGNCD
jgi:hypothetical protein